MLGLILYAQWLQRIKRIHKICHVSAKNLKAFLQASIRCSDTLSTMLPDCFALSEGLGGSDSFFSNFPLNDGNEAFGLLLPVLTMDEGAVRLSPLFPNVPLTGGVSS